MLIGWSNDLGKDDLAAMWYKGITNAKIPDKYLDYKDDDNEGNEYVYTLAVDGIIIKTICGV